MKTLQSLGALALVTGLLVGASTGCSTAEVEEESVTAQSELGRDPANCVYHHHFRKYAQRCSYPSTSQSELDQAVAIAQGALECASVAISLAPLAAGGPLALTLVPVTVANMVNAENVIGCASFIGSIIGSIFPSCYAYEIEPTAQDRQNDCAMTCRGTERVYNNDCYCGRVPLACSDAPPNPNGTPPPQSCLNQGSGQSVARGLCTEGVDNGVRNGRIYRCNSSGQDWRSCPAGTSLQACNAGTACR